MKAAVDIDGEWEVASVREVLFSDWRVASVVLAAAAFWSCLALSLAGVVGVRPPEVVLGGLAGIVVLSIAISISEGG